jgi:hypothetical protein
MEITCDQSHLQRALKILQLLPAAARSSALDFIEYLAYQEDVDLLLDEGALAEDLEAVRRCREGDYSDTMTLEEVRQAMDNQKARAAQHV